MILIPIYSNVEFESDVIVKIRLFEIIYFDVIRCELKLYLYEVRDLENRAKHAFQTGFILKKILMYS